MKIKLFRIYGKVTVFVLNATMIMFGYIMELFNQYTEKTNWKPFIMGCIAGVIPWIVIFGYFYGVDAEGIPDFVYWIFYTYLVLFNTFAINMVLQYKAVGPWRDYLFGERVYIILSLVAKSLLAWLAFGGILQPQ